MTSVEKEVKFCREFLKRQYFAKKLCRRLDTGNWKHVAEKLYSGGYIPMDAFNKAARELGFDLQKTDTTSSYDDCYINLNPKMIVFYTDNPETIKKNDVSNKIYDNVEFVDEVKWEGLNKGVSFFPVQGFYLDKNPQLLEYGVTWKQFEDMKKDFDSWFKNQTEFKKIDINAIDKGWRKIR
jgi:hypothetical protein